ncbi:HEPN domain-containing protein [Kushneria phyllosphaerae]|nr:HEPN domain-containing protein [Kushneria phyllosphaerae]
MPERLLDIAHELLSAPDTEQPRLRSVVNRAYYAAFLTARDYCSRNDVDVGHGAAHQKVIEALIDKPDLARRGNQLNMVKRLRHRADYEWNRPMTYKEAAKTLKTCRELVAFFTS